MHSTTDNAGFLPLLSGLAKEKGVIGFPGDGTNLAIECDDKTGRTGTRQT